MEYNRVIDKIKKLKELVDRGVDGEVFAAKRVIEQLCKKYDVNIEDLFKEEVKLYTFKIKYNNKFEQQLLFQCYSKVTNRKVISYYKDKLRPNIIKFELTNIEYIDLKGMFEFYRKIWSKIMKSSLNDLFEAFISKNQISHNQEDEEPKTFTPEEWEKILRIQNLMCTMEVSLYHKQLECNGKNNESER